MSEPQLPMLLCTNGNAVTRPALEYGIWLATTMKSHVVVLGIVESSDCRDRVEDLVKETAQRLQEAGISHEIRLDYGRRGTLVIAKHTRDQQYLTVLGPLGRPAWRRAVQGRSFRRLLDKINTPILYVPKLRLPLKSILLCSGGLEYSFGVKQFSIVLGKLVNARITLLHVVEPVTLEYPVAKEAQFHWQKILETDTPQARTLTEYLDDIRSSGLEVEFKVRHGNIVHEILDEVRHGEYDLVAMGSPYSARSLRHLYLPNVTAEVAEVLDRPVLSVR